MKAEKDRRRLVEVSPLGVGMLSMPYGGDKTMKFRWMKFLSRKFLFTLAFFVMAQYLKVHGKIADVWWFLASIGAIVGYNLVLAYLQKTKAGDE